MKLFLRIALMLIFAESNFSAQDLQYSLFNENPALLNPALCGVNYLLRASATYKDEWRSITAPYKSFGMNMDIRFKPENWKQIDKHRTLTFKEKNFSLFAGGFSIFNDKAGNSGLSKLNTNLNLAYFIPLSSKSFLSLGLQGALVQTQINNADLVFPNQFDGNYYDKNLASGEKFNTLFVVKPDAACGLVYSYKLKEDRIPTNRIIKLVMGSSVYHLYKDKHGFLQSKNSDAYRYVFHADLLFTVGSKSNMAWAPAFYLSTQGSSILYSAGTFFNYYFSENSKYTGINKRSSLDFGVFLKQANTLNFSFIVQMQEQYSIGVCYNFIAAPQETVSKGRGGFELMLRYTPPMAFLYEKK